MDENGQSGPGIEDEAAGGMDRPKLSAGKFHSALLLRRSLWWLLCLHGSEPTRALCVGELEPHLLVWHRARTESRRPVPSDRAIRQCRSAPVLRLAQPRSGYGHDPQLAFGGRIFSDPADRLSNLASCKPRASPVRFQTGNP